MQYTISHRMSDVHGSAIRELFKLGADPSMISFGGGNPSAETFPVPEIAEIMADVMKNAPVSVLQYGLSEGYTPLRDTMKEYLARTQGFDFEKTSCSSSPAVSSAPTSRPRCSSTRATSS